MKDEEWTSRVVFAEHCNPNAEDFLDGIAASAYGTEETVELISLNKLQTCVAVAKAGEKKYLTISRTSTVSF